MSCATHYYYTRNSDALVAIVLGQPADRADTSADRHLDGGCSRTTTATTSTEETGEQQQQQQKSEV